MGKVLGIDYGTVRTGIAISDSIGMIASPLETVATKELFLYLEKIITREKILVVVVGEARYLDGTASEITALQAKFCEELAKKNPGIRIERVDEMFTSSLAADAMRSGGFKKSARANKENLDKISAAIILQSYLDRKPGQASS